MQKLKILITGPFDYEVKKRLEEHGLEVDHRETNLSQKRLQEAIRDADGYILSGFEKITEEIIDSASRLSVIVFTGEQPETFIAPEVRSLLDERCIVLEKTPGVATNAVAEMTCGLILCALRRIPFLTKGVEDGDWPIYTGFELKGKTLGLYGMGKIGYAVAKNLRGFDLGHIIYCDIIQSEKGEKDLGAHRVEMEELFTESDVLSIHVPLTFETKGVVGETLLSKMKPTAVLINTARAAIVDPIALRRVLTENWIACAAFDGYYIEGAEYESSGDTHGLLALRDRFFCVSHQAFNSKEALKNASEAAVEKLIEYCPEPNSEQCAIGIHES